MGFRIGGAGGKDATLVTTTPGWGSNEDGEEETRAGTTEGSAASNNTGSGGVCSTINAFAGSCSALDAFAAGSSETCSSTAAETSSRRYLHSWLRQSTILKLL